MKISIDSIDAFVFDFDGVMTDNLVYLDQYGNEMVVCNRSDGIAFDVLRKIKKPAYIVSTEVNPVVKARADKLKITAIHGVKNKVNALNSLVDKYKYDLSRIMYIGNDLNDYKAILACGFSACPSDSHKKIKDISEIILKTKGGKGVVRELLEEIFDVDFVKIMNNE